MDNAHIVSPFYYTKPVPQLAALAGAGAEVQEPALGGDIQADLMRIQAPIADAVSIAARSGRRPVLTCGDCCAAIGVVAGLQRAGIDPTLVWLDAHGDFNTWETSPSGFLGGMPLAMIVGRGDLTMPGAVGLRSLAEDRVVLTDARDLDPGERAALEASGVRHVPDTATLLDTDLPEGPLYVHFDTDILPAEDAPAMNYPVRGGAPPATVKAVLARFAASGRVVAASMSAWNPDLDGDGATERLCRDAFEALVGDDG
jgi:arginase